MYADERAASEVVGSILLVAIVVIGVTALTAATVLDDATTDTKQADVAVNVTTSRVLVNHTGGEALDADEVSVIVRDGGSEFRQDGLDGVGDNFEPGEGWSKEHGLTSLKSGDSVRVIVVHDDRTVLFDSTRRVYPP